MTSGRAEGLYVNALDELLTTPGAELGVFHLGQDEVLEAVMDGTVWLRVSAIAAYRGNLSFLREGELAPAIPGFWDAAREDYRSMMTRVRGRGRVYLSGVGSRLTIVHLPDQAVILGEAEARAFAHVLSDRSAGGGSDAEAFSPLLSLRALKQPVALPVFEGVPVYCDAARTASWSGMLHPVVKPGVRIRRAGQRRTEDALQMKFDGEGTVTIGGAE